MDWGTNLCLLGSRRQLILFSVDSTNTSGPIQMSAVHLTHACQWIQGRLPSGHADRATRWKKPRKRRQVTGLAASIRLLHWD